MKQDKKKITDLENEKKNLKLEMEKLKADSKEKRDKIAKEIEEFKKKTLDGE